MKPITVCFSCVLISFLIAVPLPSVALQTDMEQYNNARKAYDNGDYDTAFTLMKPLAEKGYSDAQYNLGAMYEKGHSVKQNYVEAAKWYELSAKQGNVNAQNNIGWMYENGLGVKQDYPEALRWFELSAKQGNVTAQNNLGMMYEQGLGVKQDYVEAAKWYELSAKHGNAYAQYNLGWVYENGKGVVQDYVLAYAWYSIALINGDNIAIVRKNAIKAKLTTSQVKEAEAKIEELKKSIKPNN